MVGSRIPERLAAGTKVRRASCQADAQDQIATARAGLARPMIHAKLPLILALASRAAHVVPNARPTLPDGSVQHAHQGTAQTRGLGRTGLVGEPGRVQARLEERFVSVNVAH